MPRQHILHTCATLIPSCVTYKYSPFCYTQFSGTSHMGDFEYTKLPYQYGVPMKELRFPSVAVICAATPKSASLMSPECVRRMFAP